jgi:hypothetical protein
MENTLKPNKDAGCHTVTDKNRARAGGRPYPVRVAWRKERRVVYRDSIGRWYWADLETKEQHRAVIRGGRLG